MQCDRSTYGYFVQSLTEGALAVGAGRPRLRRLWFPTEGEDEPPEARVCSADAILTACAATLELALRRCTSDAKR
jgi:hypothetical protein